MDDLVHSLTNLLFLIFHDYAIILGARLSIIFSLSSGDIYLSLGISLSFWIIFLWVFYIPLLYYFNFSSSVLSCLSSGGTYLSLGIPLLCLFVTISDLFYCEFFEISQFCYQLYYQSNHQLLLLIAFFEAVLNSSVAGFLAWSRSFWCIPGLGHTWTIFTTQVFTYILTNTFTHIFSKV